MSQAIFKKESIRFVAAAFLASALTLALTACGGGSLQNPGGDSNFGNGDFDYGDVEDGEGDGSFRPTVSHSFTITGDGGATPTYTSPTISGADSILNVKVTPGRAEVIRATEYSGFSASYQCVTYKIALIMGSTTITTKTTKPLMPGGGTPRTHYFYNYFTMNPMYRGEYFTPCQGGVATEVLPFSSHLYAGHPSVRIKVSSVKTDFKCPAFIARYNSNPGGNQNLGHQMANYCNEPTAYYATHVSSGDLEIEVNGSSL